jgi:hypothetical protein
VKAPMTSEGQLRRAALFMLLGLGFEWLSLAWEHPLSFYVFAVGGGLCALMAVGSFLLSFISPSARKPSRSKRTAVEDPEEETAQVANG